MPQTLVNMFFVVIGEKVYPMEPFLLHQGHRKGILRIEVDKPQLVAGEHSTEARIYPRIDPRTLEVLSRFSENERREMWVHLTQPTREWGRASKANVKMSTMHEWLDEIAIKRAVCRALRLFVGIGTTAWEELPDVTVRAEDVQEARSLVAAPSSPQSTVSKEAPPTTQTTQPEAPPVETVTELPAELPGEWPFIVPITKDTLKVKDGSQSQLIDHLGVINLVRLDETVTEAAIIPENPKLQPDAGPLQWLRRTLVALRGKYPQQFQFQLVSGEGCLRAVVVRGELTPDRVKELVGWAEWAFKRAAESRQHP